MIYNEQKSKPILIGLCNLREEGSWFNTICVAMLQSTSQSQLSEIKMCLMSF